jgi:hypothetical protein
MMAARSIAPVVMSIAELMIMCRRVINEAAEKAEVNWYRVDHDP